MSHSWLLQMKATSSWESSTASLYPRLEHTALAALHVIAPALPLTTQYSVTRGSVDIAKTFLSYVAFMAQEYTTKQAQHNNTNYMTFNQFSVA